MRRTGYTIAWTAVGTNTTVYLQDLDPGVTWTVKIDGGAASSVTPNAGGHYALSVGGSGAHSIVTLGGGL